MRFQILALAAFTGATVAAPPQHAHAAAIYNAKREVAEGHRNYHIAARRAAVAVAVVPAPNDGGASCEAGAPCTGDVRHYDTVVGEYGACGRHDVDISIFHGVCMPWRMMGELSNTNPYCGLSVTVTSPTGVTFVASVIDKCMGCSNRDLDLTTALFDAVTGHADGVGVAYTWHFN